MAGKFMRGALVQFMPTFLRPLPNVIIFQFNPETMTHSWTQPESAEGAALRSNPLAVRGLPGEEFSFTISMDAQEMIADGSPIAQAAATATGIYTRLAALEMLMFPTQAFAVGGLVGQVGASLLNRAFIPARSVPESQTPVVIFVWGPERIVPVRVTSLTITEKLYDELLNPIQADASLGLRVLTPEELLAVSGTLAPVAKAAYLYSQALRQTLAVANLENAVESIIGMLPVG
ncbi:MAG TPA: hypothetical protein VG675_07665 [Bryobacteraceae bacterium]|nr:hypothetical protein [Bryobacteraceae bacterium]